MSIANTPTPPYYAVIFTSVLSETLEGYDKMNRLTEEKASKYDGFLGNEYFRDENGFGIHISYWDNLETINLWRNDQLHRQAKKSGMEGWYKQYKLRISKVEFDSEGNYESNMER
mgnify:CR=1 FL=1